MDTSCEKDGIKLNHTYGIPLMVKKQANLLEKHNGFGPTSAQEMLLERGGLEISVSALRRAGSI
jgi:hypothetical protein